nr:flagellar protein FlaG [Polaromonas sp. UBA4122]
MSISTASISAADGLQHSQLATLPVAGGSAPGAVSAARAASVSAAISKTPAVQAAAAAKAVEVKLNAKQVQQSLEDINKVLTGLSISVQFRVDPDYKELIVKVVDQDTGKLIRQIPTEEAVKISKVMDNLKGLLFAQSV